MTDPFNGHTGLLLRAAAVVIPLSLLLSAAAVVGAWLTAEELEDERAARESDACDTALETRSEQRDMWVRVLQRAGVDEPTIDILRDGYDTLPDPAACAP